jgi:hypothetical protein
LSWSSSSIGQNGPAHHGHDDRRGRDACLQQSAPARALDRSAFRLLTGIAGTSGRISHSNSDPIYWNLGPRSGPISPSRTSNTCRFVSDSFPLLSPGIWFQPTPSAEFTQRMS